MTLFELVFGRRPSGQARAHARLPVIEHPPTDVSWRAVRPRRQAPVCAELAEHDGSLSTAHGELSYERGQHYLVTYPDGAESVVRKDIFERTYRCIGGTAYEKRPDLILRYFTLPHDVMVRTEEGLQHAEAGDWIMQGVAGELWPVPSTRAEDKYALVGSA